MQKLKKIIHCYIIIKNIIIIKQWAAKLSVSFSYRHTKLSQKSPNSASVTKYNWLTI